MLGQTYFETVKQKIEGALGATLEVIFNIKTGEIFQPSQLLNDLNPSFNDGYECWPLAYCALLRLLPQLNISRESVFLDIGCGAGRALFMAAAFRPRKVIGLELDAKAFSMLEKNYNKYRFNKKNIIIIKADAAQYEFTEETIVYMFNPFGPDTLREVLKNLLLSIERNPRQVTIAYTNAKHSDVILSQDWLKPVPIKRPRHTLLLKSIL
jgi:SAM-dependent methyltransferase